ncbi:Fur family transcriptional regulator [Silvibacterium acidisoli]|uniref:Fur family transcriptional regulator n=1 Tax=Acidobacteriaceae bacterium ZG23-2 TaxID=2883246 RepID=UPI00406CEA0B
MTVSDANQFRALCDSAGIAVTHQRQVVYEELCAMHGHPSPEEVYLRVKERIPAISLATVYKNIHTFIESGIFREVSLHHGSLRVETNAHSHHHLVCTQCKSITDIDADEFLLSSRGQSLPNKFLPERFSVEVLGLCVECQQKQASLS